MCRSSRVVSLGDTLDAPYRHGHALNISASANRALFFLLPLLYLCIDGICQPTSASDEHVEH